MEPLNIHRNAQNPFKYLFFFGSPLNWNWPSAFQILYNQYKSVTSILHRCPECFNLFFWVLFVQLIHLPWQTDIWKPANWLCTAIPSAFFMGVKLIDGHTKRLRKITNWKKSKAHHNFSPRRLLKCELICAIYSTARPIHGFWISSRRWRMSAGLDKYSETWTILYRIIMVIIDVAIV